MRGRTVVTMIALAACSAKGGKTPSTPTPTAPTAPASVTPATAAAPTIASAGSAATPAPAPAVPALPANAVKVTLADVGLEPGSLDRSVDPCSDFYQFTCGGWIAANPIPADHARWGRGAELDEHNKRAIRSLLEDASKGAGTDPATRKLGDFYASCMDEPAIESTGLAALGPLLDKVTKVKDAKSWLAAVIELHRHGSWVVWTETAQADLKDSRTNLTYLDAAGLGLPDRDYYVKPELADKLTAYQAHVGRLLALAKLPASGAADVVAIETELAKLTKTGVEKRDVPASYNPTDLKALGKQVKTVDWKAYFKALDVTPSKKLVVGTPKFFAALDRVRGAFKPAQWASYFTYHLLQDAAIALPKAFDDEAFQLAKVLTGVEQQEERSKRCIDATQKALGELLGQQYVAKYFPGSAKQSATTLIDAIVHVMGDQLGTLDWMGAATRTSAQAKLAKIVRMIGFPDTWRTYDFEVKRADFAGNALRASAFETHRVLAKSGKPVDRTEWFMNAFTVNAYYEPTANTTALPAGILQPPFFGQDRSVAANLGGIGMVIGHELTHGFDDEGAQFDADGNLRNWWSKEDKAKFDAKGSCVADMYSSFEVMPSAFVQGRLTLGENIADLGGVKLAYRAYRALRKDAPKVYVADGFTEDQQFFIAVGQAWCSKDRPAEAQRRLTVDRHAPPKFRVFGALRNLEDFAAAFHCAAGTAMHPANSCSVW